MTQVNHNRLRGKALYIEVRDLLTRCATPMTNNQVRDALAKQYNLDRTDRHGLTQLYYRIARVTDQLLYDGYLLRDQELGANRHIRYTYTVAQTTTPCSA
jgi:hypothetical protein